MKDADNSHVNHSKTDASLIPNWALEHCSQHNCHQLFGGYVGCAPLKLEPPMGEWALRHHTQKCMPDPSQVTSMVGIGCGRVLTSDEFLAIIREEEQKKTEQERARQRTEKEQKQQQWEVEKKNES